MRISFRATEDSRCDQALRTHLSDLSRTYICNHVTGLTINGLSAKLSHRVQIGDVIVAIIIEPSQDTHAPCNIPFDVVYEDDHLLVINKPDNISVHPAQHHSHDNAPTIVQGLHYRCPQLIQSRDNKIEQANASDDLYREGIIHRLDKKTSGLLMLAKQADAIKPLQMLFRKRKVKKWYLAVVKGHPRLSYGTFEDTLIRHPVHRQRFTTSDDSTNGKSAKTDYHCLWSDGLLTVVILQPLTGRTHQLRVQLATRNTPVVGDDVYGRTQPSLALRYGTRIDRMYLHAVRLEFQHPYTKRMIRLCAPLPQPFRKLITTIKHY